jgi:hypothetical protein
MATLYPFAGNYTGTMNIYVYGWINNYVGTGGFTSFSSFQAVFSGQYDYLGVQGNLLVSLELTDQDPDATSGPCSITLLGNTDSNATYQVNGQYLTITTALNSEPFNIYSYKGGTEFDDLQIPVIGLAGVWLGPSSTAKELKKDMAKAPQPQQEILKVKEAWVTELRSLPNVQSVSLGYKSVKGKASMQSAICVHVSRKVPANLLSPSERIPPSIQGVPTDVVENQQMTSYSNTAVNQATNKIYVIDSSNDTVTVIKAN